jgi:hypothetical protein
MRAGEDPFAAAAADRRLIDQLVAEAWPNGCPNRPFNVILNDSKPSIPYLPSD